MTDQNALELKRKNLIHFLGIRNDGEKFQFSRIGVLERYNRDVIVPDGVRRLSGAVDDLSAVHTGKGKQCL